MDAGRLKAAWEKFQMKIRALRSRQLEVLKSFSKKAEEEQIAKLKNGLK